MQLQDLMALAWLQGVEVAIEGVGHHQYPQAGGIGGGHGGKQGRPLGWSQPARRAGHADHAEGLDPHGGHGGRLVVVA